MLVRILKYIRQTKSVGMVMMIIFFEHKNVMYKQALPLKITVTGEYYVSFLKHLQQNLSIKRHRLIMKRTL